MLLVVAVVSGVAEFVLFVSFFVCFCVTLCLLAMFVVVLVFSYRRRLPAEVILHYSISIFRVCLLVLV